MNSEVIELTPEVARALSPVRITLLRLIAAEPGHSVTSLSAASGLKATALNHHLKILEQTGFIEANRGERRPSLNNRRSIKLTQTQVLLSLNLESE